MMKPKLEEWDEKFSSDEEKNNNFNISKMRHLFIIAILSSVAFSQLRLSVHANGKLYNKDIETGLSLNYDKVIFKQANIKSGIGAEYMLKVDSKDLSYTDLSSNSIYVFSRFIYEKKWASYLRFGFNDLKSNEINSSGVAIAFGADYKLNDNWHLELGYHISTIDDKSYTRPVLSIARHFKKKDD